MINRKKYIKMGCGTICKECNAFGNGFKNVFLFTLQLIEFLNSDSKSCLGCDLNSECLAFSAQAINISLSQSTVSRVTLLKPTENSTSPKSCIRNQPGK